MNQPASSSVEFREKLLSYWHRRRTFYSAAMLTFFVAVVLALALPATYRSMATILIEQQEIPQEMVRSVITSFADQRVQVITQRVMTTQNLLSLIDRYDLYPTIRQKEPREVLLEKLRGDIGMHMISADVIDPRSGRPTQATIAFSVSYQSHSPDLALKVANDLTTLYLNENLSSRTQLSQQTASFFSEESARQAANIAELDKTLANFKEKHRRDLPDLAQLNVASLERTELELRDAETRLGALDSQRVLLEAQLAQINPTLQVYSDTGQRVLGPEDRLKSVKAQLAGDRARYAPGHPDIVTAEREVSGLEKAIKGDDQTGERARQLAEAQAALARAQEKYSPEHPDVLRLKRAVEGLQAAVSDEASLGNKRQITDHADNPVYIQVKGELDSVAVERTTAVARRDALRTRFDDYERRLSRSPEVEREFRTLARALDSAQLKYQEILAKQTEAKVSENLETERKGERFTLIEPPQMPEKPISPNRTMILFLGFCLSLVLGAAAAAAHENLDSSVRGPGDIRALLQVPALASIPIIVTREDRRRRRRLHRYSWAGGVAALCFAAAAVHVLVRPLDILWTVILRRLGV